MSKTLNEAISDIEDILMTVNPGLKQSVFHCMLQDIQTGSGAIKFSYVDIAENEISKYIETLSKDDKISVFSETESGILYGDKTNLYPVDQIDLELQTELLSELIDDVEYQAGIKK